MTLGRMLPRALVLTALLAPAAWADRVAVPNEIGLPAYPCEATDGRTAIGAVSALTGAATFSTPGCAPAPLACDAALHGGERLATAAGGQLGLQVGDAWVQLSDDSAATLRQETDGTTTLVVERGTARVMRVGDGPAPRVETPDLAATAPGDDVVARVADGASSLCSWSEPLDVRTKATGAVSQAATGECVAPGAAVAATFVSTADVARCGVAVGDLTPYDVAAGPTPYLPPPEFPPPIVPPPLCTNGSCTGPEPPPPPARIPVVENPGGFEPPP